MKKTFKIGEYAVGGIITADIKSDGALTIQALEYTSKAFVKGRTFLTFNHFNVVMYLNDLTSSYYADTIMEWIESKR